jgi:hypothetical protein
MKLEEILNMSAGRDMDALVAEKVLGWTPWLEKRGEYNYVVWQRSEDREPWFAHRDWEKHKARYSKLIKYDSHHHIEVGLYKFSTNVSDAWDVVEKMKDKFSFILKHDDPPGIDDKYRWYCELYAKGEPFIDYDVHGPTAPLVICRVALLYAFDERQEMK